jgi:tetratricopeptide (TPR) repeat protein
MKAEERKGLETNTLVTLLKKSAEDLKHGPSRTTLTVVGVIALVVVLYLVWRWFAMGATAADSARWLRWEELSDPEELSKAPNKDDRAPTSPRERQEYQQITLLEQFIKANPGSTQERMARFQLARLLLGRGVRDLGTLGTRRQALEDLDRAAGLYEKLSRESTGVALLQEEALLNAGKAREARSELDRARQHYRQLEKDYPRSEFGQVAAQQLKRLETNKGDLEALEKRLAPVMDMPAPVPPVPPAGTK